MRYFRSFVWLSSTHPCLACRLVLTTKDIVDEDGNSLASGAYAMIPGGANNETSGGPV